MKRISGFILALALMLLMSMPAYAASVPYLYDNADLLSSSEEVTIESALETVSEKYKIDTAILTVYGLDGKSPEAYADDFYDNTFKTDGIILLIDMESRSWQIETGGKCINAVNDDGIRYLENEIVDFLSDGSFQSAFLEFVDGTAYLMQCYEEGSPYVYKEPIPWGRNIAIAIVVGLIFGFAVAGSRKAQLKSVHRRVSATEYTDTGSLVVTKSNEFFLYSNVSRTEKPKDNDGGSSTHMSSGGFSHGGGGGRF